MARPTRRGVKPVPPEGDANQDMHSGRPTTPENWRDPPKHIMRMGPLIISLGAMLVFALVVGFVVVLPLTTFEPPPSPNATPLSDAAWRGKQNFQQQGCYLCHSGFTRPQDVAVGQYFVYTRVSEAGDWPGAGWTPNLFGSIRTGPDLSNEGGQHPDDWQRAHYFDPRYTTPKSVMPRFSFWSDARTQDAIAFNAFQGGKEGLLRYATVTVGDNLMDINMGKKDPQKVYPDLVQQLGGAYVPGGKPSDKSPSGLPWKAVWMMNSFDRGYWLTDNPLPLTQQNLLRGKIIFQERCVGCHGVKGNGQGPAAQFLSPTPFDFTSTSMMGGQMGPFASPGMMYHRILTAGPGTAMENFGTRLSVEDIWRVVLFLKTIPNGSLADPQTLPTPDMYLNWEPPKPMLEYIATHPLESRKTGPTHETDLSPFESGARWLAPGLAPEDEVVVGGKLPMTLARLTDLIQTTYTGLLEQAFNESQARGDNVLSREQLVNTEELQWFQP